MESYLTAKDVALLLKLSEQSIRYYTMKKIIPFYKVNRAVRYKQTEIEAWFEQRQAAKSVKAQNDNQDGGLFNNSEAGTNV